MADVVTDVAVGLAQGPETLFQGGLATSHITLSETPVKPRHSSWCNR